MILNTTELRIGDVIENHGMRVKLDTAPHVYQVDRREPGTGQVTVYSWPGLVLNPDEAIAKHGIPYGFLYDATGGGYDYDKRCWIRSTRPAWTIQGNWMARWSVIREHEIGC